MSLLRWFKLTDSNDDIIDSRQGALKVFKVDNLARIKDLYFYRTDATPTITSNTSVGDTTINIDSNTGITNGEAITFYEGVRVFQSIVVSTTATTVVIASPLDFAFTTAATVESGPWNMNLDGSVTTEEFCIKPPPGACLRITRLSVNMQDGTAMDSGMFGGISALTNGFFFQVRNDCTNNVGLFVNNIGFKEQGFETDYDPKAPSGTYGVTHSKKLEEANGAVICLDGNLGCEICAEIRDDLTGLTMINATISGYIFEDE